MTWSVGFGVVAVGLVVQQLAEAQGGAGDDRQAQLGVADGEPSGPDGGLDVAAGPGREPAVRADQGEAVVQQHLAQLGLPAVQACR